MQRLSPRGIQPSITEDDILVTRDDLAQWLPLSEILDPDTLVQRCLVPLTGVDEDGEPCLIWAANDELVMVEVTL